jgi:3-hydroxyacyl-CoA dehydrogenase
MFHADQVGLEHIAAQLDAVAARTGDESLRPAPLLQRLAAAGSGFASLPTEAAA